MKLRIRGDSIRLRLKQGEVAQVAAGEISDMSTSPFSYWWPQNGPITGLLAIGSDPFPVLTHCQGLLSAPTANVQAAGM